MVLAGQGDRLGAVTGLAEYLHIGGRLDENPEPAAHQSLVVGDDDADHDAARSVGMRARTWNPEAVGSATSLPP